MNNQFMRRKANRKSRNEDSDEALVGLLDGSDNDEAGNEEIGMQIKKKPQTDFIEYVIQEGDTLSSLSLQFNCTVSQIKQFNNIHRENEIFALRVVRIPIIPFSVVTEKVTGAQSIASEKDIPSNLKHIVSDKNAESTGIPQAILVDTSLDQHLSDIDSSSDISVCNPLLTPLPAPIIPHGPPLDPSLSTSIIQPPNNSSSFLQCNGADCGIPWLMLFVCTLALGFVLPLIYIFFVYEGKKAESALSS